MVAIILFDVMLYGFLHNLYLLVLFTFFSQLGQYPVSADTLSTVRIAGRLRFAPDFRARANRASRFEVISTSPRSMIR